MTELLRDTRVVVMAGGTGGHVFPALAVAQCLRERGVQVTWLGTRRGLEAKLVPPTGIPVDWVSVSGLRGKGALSWVLAPLRLTLALGQAVAVMLRRRPQAVLGMGGFVSGPGGLAAWLLRKPLLIHEQNAVAGLTNRLLAGFATQVMEAFPDTFPPRRGPLHTGNPVRTEIAALPAPERRFAGRNGPIRLLVLGGSQGARALNLTLPQALSRLPIERQPEVWHQAGARNLEAAREAYARAGVTARVEPFIDDMAAAYGWADLVVCRAGALTLAELSATGVGAVLVPYPYAVDDHQTRNAQWLVRAGAAVMLQEADLGPERLAELLDQLCDRKRLAEMAVTARDQAMPDATDQVAAACLAAIGR